MFARQPLEFEYVMKCTLIQTLLALRLCAARDLHLPCRSLEAGSEKNTTNHNRRWQRGFFFFSARAQSAVESEEVVDAGGGREDV